LSRATSIAKQDTLDSEFNRFIISHMSADAMPRKIPFHRRVLYLSVPYLFVGLILLGIEGATRLFLPHIPPLDVLIESPSLRPDIASEKDSPMFMADPLLFWRIRPNLKEVYWDFTVISTNGQGLRHDGDIGRKRAGAFRIVCVGDSVTFGYRVPLAFPQNPQAFAHDELPYPLQLEREIRRANPGKTIDVVPLAVPAYTTHQGLNILRREIDRLQPDIVTACFGWNDVCLRPVPDRVSMPVDWLHVTVRALICRSQTVAHFVKWRHTRRTNPQSTTTSVPRVSRDDYVTNLLEIAKLSRAHDAQAVLIAAVYHDAKANPPEAALMKQYRDALREAANANSVSYLQIDQLTEAGYPGNDNLFGELIHPNIVGHQLMTTALLKFFEEHQMLQGLTAPANQ
jgi:lysophospholipase L1-like esterase